MGMHWFLLLLLWPAIGFAAPEAPNNILQCQAASVAPKRVCEVGGPFLCLNTLEGGVVQDFILIKGRLNLTNAVLGQLSISVQHEYTKKLQTIALSMPLTQNCWDSPLSEQNNFCLEKEGLFAVRVPLPELGPYTLFVAASRMQGSSMQVTGRTSRVIAPTVMPDIISYDPGIAGGSIPSGTRHVKVSLDLLSGCETSREACDFIGSTTGGLFVTVENKISGYSAKSVRCETNSVQGAAGKFVVGVPVQPGRNQLTITVCNAATGFDPKVCPQIVSPIFETGGTISRIEILSPTSDSALWESSQTPKIPLRFKVVGLDSKICDDRIQVGFNLDSLQNVCANGEGIYEIMLTPKEGYNIASITANTDNEKLNELVSFGWGKVFKPSQEDPFLGNAAQISLSASFFNQTLFPYLNRYLASQDFKEWFKAFTDNLGQEAGSSPLKIRLVSPPQIGKIALNPIQFQQDRLQFLLQAEDVSLAIQLYKDENGDDIPDIYLPLKISFKRLESTPVIERQMVGGKLVVKLSSTDTDCSYKRKGACFGMPALLVPKRFEGNANSAGAFAVCDRSQEISKKMDEICHALNVLDRQTGGVMQEKILDALNSTYASGASASIASGFREGFDFEKETDLFKVKGKIGVDDLKITLDGLMVSLKTLFGDKPLSFLTDLVGAPSVTSASTVSLGVFLPVISQLFGGLEGKNGEPFSLTIDDAFFKNLGFDFQSCCVSQDPKELPSSCKVELLPLCNVRPRAKEIFGSIVSSFGYLEPTAPLTLTFSPSKNFPLRVKALDSQELVAVEFADWELAIGSENNPLVTAKLALKLVLQVSKPILVEGDAENFYLTLKIVKDRSRTWVTEKRGSNTTIIPGESLLSNLASLLQLALDNFSQEGKEIKIPISRNLGIPQLRIDNLNTTWDSTLDRLLLQITPILQ